MANFFRSVLLRLQNKSEAATTSNKPVTADAGYDGLGTVTITPQQHSGTYTPAANKSNNDMGAVHNNRYVNTSGMIVPSGNKAISANGTGIDVASYSTVSVSVPHPTHTTTYTPTANKSDNDMGATHSYRYVNTSGMITPSGTKDNSSSPYTSNNTYTITGLDSYAGVKIAVNVPNPTLSGDADEANVLANKTFYKNSYTKKTGTMANNGAFEGDIDPSVSVPYELSPGYYSSIELSVLPHTGYSPTSSTYTQLAMGETKSIDLGQYHKYRYVRVQAAAPSGNKSITANGTGIDVSSYSTVSVSVPHPTHTTSFTPAANLKGASGNANDMGSTHSYRYVDTSGMIVPSGNKSITANGTGIDVSSYSTVSVDVPHPTHTTTYTPAANKSNNDMGATHSYRYVNTSGMIVPSGNKSITANGTGIDVASYSTVSVSVSGTSIAPDNSSPVAMTSGILYTPSKNGYAIESYTSIAVDSGTETSISSKTGMYKITKSELTTPATVVGGTIQSKTPDTTGVSFDAGMVKMSSGGYAYSSKPTPQLKRTTLWTNSAPTSSFSAQSVTLSQSIRNFDYIEVSWRSMTSQTNITSTIMSVSEFVSISSSYNYCRLGTVNYGNSDSVFHRSCTYESNTSVKFVTGSSSGRCVPQYIYGLKLSI